MTTATTSLPSTVAAPSRAALPPTVALAVYAVMLLSSTQLLRDADTFWQIAVGNWMIDHHAVTQTDVYSWTLRGAPWMSTQWLSQVAFALAYRAMGWSGTVLLAALAIAAAFGLLTRFVARYLAPVPTLILVSAALALAFSHLLARPHVLAMPIMVAFVGGLVTALDARRAPSLLLLPLMLLWANLHGGFVLGLALVAPIGMAAVWATPKDAQPAMLMRWLAFGVLALAAACMTPYGWDSILASRRILSLGKALALIKEWTPADFGRIGPLEIAVLGGLGLALWRGFTLSPVRVLLIVGFVFMALSHVRNAEVLAMLAPLVLARPLAEHLRDSTVEPSILPRRTLAGFALVAVAGTAAIFATHRYQPDSSNSPAAAVQVLKERGIARVLNDYDFGGYLIAEGVAPYIDGRTELYGEAFVLEHNNFVMLQNPDDFFRLAADPRIEATLLRSDRLAIKMLDHLDGWKRIYTDDLAVVHVRDTNAKALQPVLRSSLD